MNRFRNSLARACTDESGLESVEYAIITGLMVLGILVALAAIGTWVAGVYTDVQTLIGA